MSSLVEWRQYRPKEWWLVFVDAPPMPRLRDKDGAVWPPMMSATRSGSCWHLMSYINGAMPDDDNLSAEDVDYMHVCDLGSFLSQLTALLVQSGVDEARE